MLSTETGVWRGLRKGSVINLTDEQTLTEMIEDGGPNLADGIDLIVEKTVFFENDNCTWILVETDHHILNLVVKLVDDNVEIKVVFQPEWSVQGSRQDYCNADCHWLFKEPEDVDNFVPGELEYADSITRQYDDVGLVKFEAKHGTVYFTNYSQFKQLREWTADNEDMDNPDLIVFEIGGVTDDGDTIEIGGWVELYQGATVTPGDVNLLPV